MINKILVPVDFSRGSAASLRYAEAFAAAVNASLVQVIHVFTPPSASTEGILVPLAGELMDERSEQMEKFLADIPSAGVNRKSELFLGFAADKIVDQSERFDLIIMGTTGDSDLLEELFGSVSSAVAERAHCPVLLIPNRALFQDYKHILYASNSLSLSKETVHKFKDFNSLFDARVHFVHVNEEGKENEPGEREALFAPLFTNPDPEFSFELHEVESSSIQEGLKDYLNSHPINLAVMVTKQRGFWGRLFHHSETKQMVLHPTTVMLVLHSK
jgi:nucleotide-binding universal stress UspA family protein